MEENESGFTSILMIAFKAAIILNVLFVASVILICSYVFDGYQ